MPLLRCRVGRRSLGSLAAGLLMAALVAGCGSTSTPTGEAPLEPDPSALLTVTVSPALPFPSTPSPAASLPASTPPPAAPVPSATLLPPLVDPALDLLSGPVVVPLRLSIPALDVSAPVWGVGITADNIMDAPKGPIDDGVWQTAFWYRGSSLPGDSGTAVIAGHINDPLSRPAIFARLDDLVPGDAIVLHNSRTGLDLRYLVTQVETYSLAQSSDPAVLAQIYGAGPAAGLGPQPAPDGLAHLSLITCTGSIINGEFDHHVVVYAVLAP